MTDFSGDFGEPLHLSGDAAPPRDGEEGGARFGRGWIPGDRDIGLPDDAVSCSAEPGDVEGFTPHTAWDARAKVRFLDHLSEKGDVRAACARVGMSRTSAYLLRRRDAAFAQAWRAALVLARAHAEEVLATRALDGVVEAVWFRGELVGRRRKYDTRLLLAHLARLDRAAEADGDDAAASAQALADRFDEALAVVAGERARDAFPDLVPGPRREEEAPVLRAPEDLPPPRAAYLEAAVDTAWIEARTAWFDEVDAIDRALAEDEGGEEDGGAAASDYPPGPERADFHEASAARWDGWQSRAFARVDALLAAEVEIKSMDGLGGVRWADSRRETTGSGGESGPDGAGNAALDRVNRVNLSARRPIGTVCQNVSEGGNASANLMLSIVKAGAALPPPLPSCAGRHFPYNRESRPVG